MELSDFSIGDRVEVHPATDVWMQGDRFGVVVKIGRAKLTLRMDRSDRELRFAPGNIYGKVYD
jgi:hypothetical protein